MLERLIIDVYGWRVILLGLLALLIISFLGINVSLFVNISSLIFFYIFRDNNHYANKLVFLGLSNQLKYV